MVGTFVELKVRKNGKPSISDSCEAVQGYVEDKEKKW